MLAAPMDVKIEALPQAVVVHIKGDLLSLLQPLETTFLQLSAQRPQARRARSRGRNVLSSLGMGSILAFRRGLVPHSGQVHLAAVQPLVLDAFRRAILYDVFSNFSRLSPKPAPNSHPSHKLAASFLPPHRRDNNRQHEDRPAQRSP